MNLKHNIIANYASQIYSTLIGIVMVPIYVRYMGVEAYGLVGFFATLQAWFQLLDIGITPTMARETARFNGGAIDALTLRRLLRALEGVFIGVAILGGVVMLVGSSFISTSWLKVQHLSLVDVQHSIMLMSVIIALRFVSSLYRSAINGFERLVWLSGFNSAIATIRFIFVIPFFIYVGTSPTQFFAYQLAVAIIELIVLVINTYGLLPKVHEGHRLPWRWEPLRGVLKFSLGIAFTSSIWVFVTQTDKLVLSKLLPLTDYGYFTLAVLMASGVLIVSGPISVALLPRLARMSAAGDEIGLIRLYRNATQLVAIISIPAALALAICAEQVLWVWTGNAVIVHKAAPVLMLYALGNGIVSVAAFPYYLQYAKGDLKLHIIGQGLLVMLLVPALVWATLRYGAIGAGWAWLGANAAYFLAWLPKVHSRFEKGLHTSWLLKDVGVITVPTVIAAIVMQVLLPWPKDRLQVVIGVGAVSLMLLSIAAASSSWVRETVRNKWHEYSAGKSGKGKISWR